MPGGDERFTEQGFDTLDDHAAAHLGRGRRPERHRVVRVGPVHHGAGHQDHPADPAGRRRGQHGLRGPHVDARRPGLGVRRLSTSVCTSTSTPVSPPAPGRGRRPAARLPRRRRPGGHRSRSPGGAGDAASRSARAWPSPRAAGDRHHRAAPGGLGQSGGRGRLSGRLGAAGGSVGGSAGDSARRSAPGTSPRPARLPGPVRGPGSVRLRRTWACAVLNVCRSRDNVAGVTLPSCLRGRGDG